MEKYLFYFLVIVFLVVIYFLRKNLNQTIIIGNDTEIDSITQNGRGSEIIIHDDIKNNKIKVISENGIKLEKKDVDELKNILSDNYILNSNITIRK